jgi:hypothetical protein
MPQRFLKTGITTSPKWNKTSWPSQSLYIRLLTLVDDYGRYDGRASVIWGQCFAVWNEHNPNDSIDLQQVAQMLQELAGNGLLDLYQFEDKKVIQFTGWTERIREGVKEKWLIPVGAQKLQEVAGSCVKILPPSPPPSPTTPPPVPFDPASLFPELPDPFAEPEKTKPEWKPTELMRRMNALLRRRDTTRWSKEEIKALKAIGTPDESDFKAVEAFYAAKHVGEKDYRRHTLEALLNNWGGEVDKARRYKPNTGF